MGEETLSNELRDVATEMEGEVFRLLNLAADELDRRFNLLDALYATILNEGLSSVFESSLDYGDLDSYRSFFGLVDLPYEQDDEEDDVWDGNWEGSYF